MGASTGVKDAAGGFGRLVVVVPLVGEAGFLVESFKQEM